MSAAHPDESITIGGQTLTPDELAELVDATRGNPFLIAEAAASVALDRDGRAGQTRHLCDHRCGCTPGYQPCPRGPHRGPGGPNEDLAQCRTCRSPTYALRPEGETYGYHSPDCSLPARHESYCQPGGDGHADAPLIRGYWGIDQGRPARSPSAADDR